MVTRSIEEAQPSDGVAAQLRDIERQGGGMARFAHACAGLLLVAGSLGSLISISATAFRNFLSAAQAGRLDLPDLLNAVVGVLLVLAGDAALLYAASMLRVLRSSQAPREESTVHLWVMWGVSTLEAGTYLYMAWLFDKPTSPVLWLIDVGRAIAWPLLCAYLSMARPLPVGPRDIMYHSALASGKGVVRDIATLSADPDAPLHHKVRIFRAASNMTSGDRAKLDTLVSELTTVPSGTVPEIFEEATASKPLTPDTEASQEAPTRPPTGPGSPTASKRTQRRETVATPPRVVSLPPTSRRTAQPTRKVAQARTRQRVGAEKRIRALLEEDPRLPFSELVRRSGASESTVSKWVAVVEAERAGQVAR